jgi:hypothetical protein
MIDGECQKIDLEFYNASPMIMTLGEISSVQIYSNWTQETTSKFKRAVNKVVDLNHILSGRMESKKFGEAHVITHQFTNFIKVNQYTGRRFNLDKKQILNAMVPDLNAFC